MNGFVVQGHIYLLIHEFTLTYNNMRYYTCYHASNAYLACCPREGLRAQNFSQNPEYTPYRLGQE